MSMDGISVRKLIKLWKWLGIGLQSGILIEQEIGIYGLG
jgi:hypothetical protein